MIGNKSACVTALLTLIQGNIQTHQNLYGVPIRRKAHKKSQAQPIHP